VTFTEENLKDVEKKMRNIISQKENFRNFEVNYNDAKQILKTM
jgi:threonyl-tRNA synthetase